MRNVLTETFSAGVEDGEWRMEDGGHVTYKFYEKAARNISMGRNEGVYSILHF